MALRPVKEKANGACETQRTADDCCCFYGYREYGETLAWQRSLLSGPDI